MLECWQQAAKFKVSVGLWIFVDMVIIGDMMRFRLFEFPFVLAQTKKLEKMSLPLAKFSEEFMVIYMQLCTCINVVIQCLCIRVEGPNHRLHFAHISDIIGVVFVNN